MDGERVMLSAVILAKNEEKHLPGCLASLKWADEVVVVDTWSTDRTAQIALDAGARVEQHPFENYAAQRDFALSVARGNWVFFVDADERVTAELRGEIQRLLANDSRDGSIAGYWIPRKNYIFGSWVRHTGWYPDRQLRLMLRGAAHYDPARPVHELVQLDGAEGSLNEHLIHINYETIGEFVRKQRHFATFDAQALMDKGLRAHPHNFVLQPLREYRRRFLSLQGYRDGWRGWLLSILMAWYMFEVYRQLALNQQKAGG